MNEILFTANGISCVVIADKTKKKNYVKNGLTVFDVDECILIAKNKGKITYQMANAILTAKKVFNGEIKTASPKRMSMPGMFKKKKQKKEVPRGNKVQRTIF